MQLGINTWRRRGVVRTVRPWTGIAWIAAVAARTARVTFASFRLLFLDFLTRATVLLIATFLVTNLQVQSGQSQFVRINQILRRRLRPEKLKRVLSLFVRWNYVQAGLIGIFRFLNVVLVLVAASQSHKSLAHILACIGMASVQLQCGFKVTDRFLEGATVGVEGATGNQSFDVTRINAERIVQALKSFRVTTLFEVFDSLGNGAWW